MQKHRYDEPVRDGRRGPMETDETERKKHGPAQQKPLRGKTPKKEKKGTGKGKLFSSWWGAGGGGTGAQRSGEELVEAGLPGEFLHRHFS